MAADDGYYCTIGHKFYLHFEELQSNQRVKILLDLAKSFPPCTLKSRQIDSYYAGSVFFISDEQELCHEPGMSASKTIGNHDANHKCHHTSISLWTKKRSVIIDAPGMLKEFKR